MIGVVSVAERLVGRSRQTLIPYWVVPEAGRIRSTGWTTSREKALLRSSAKRLPISAPNFPSLLSMGPIRLTRSEPPYTSAGRYELTTCPEEFTTQVRLMSAHSPTAATTP